jgi:hypothetical protein
MATTSNVSVETVKRLPGRRYDHVFFTSMIVIMFGAVFFGFARSYYLAGVYSAPPLTPILHVHGAVFSLWMLVILAQTLLVSAKRVDLHRRLGVAGLVLAGLMFPLGVMAAADSVGRGINRPHPPDPLAFTVVPITSICLFAVLIALAYRARKDSPMHKRLVLLAMTSPIVAGIARWPFPWLFHNAEHATLVSFIFLAALVVYDLWSTHKLHRATLWGSLLLIVVEETRGMIGATETWHAFARWLQSLNL